jgi:uncharacterized membrane protein
MWYTIMQRLRSPVVVGAVIVAGFNFVSELTGADFSGIANVIVAAVTALYAVFSALNNPTTKDSF